MHARKYLRYEYPIEEERNSVYEERKTTDQKIKMTMSEIVVLKSLIFGQKNRFHITVQTNDDYYQINKRNFQKWLQCNLQSALLWCGTRPNEWGAQWDLNSLV